MILFTNGFDPKQTKLVQVNVYAFIDEAFLLLELLSLEHLESKEWA